MKDIKDVIILVLIALVAATCLSVVYTSTKDRIAEMKRRELQEALKKVMPFLESEPVGEDFNFNDQTVTIYPVLKDDVLQGAGVKLTTKEGFSGNIVILMGIDNDARVTGFYMLDHKETPGLGTKAAKKKFWGQFIGKSRDIFKFKVKKDKGDVEAITAATITSRAVSGALDQGLQIFEEFKKNRGEK